MEPDGHDWEERPLREKSVSGSSFRDKNGDIVHMTMNMEFIMCKQVDGKVVEAATFLKCRRCGQSKVDGSDAEPCDVRRVRDVMEK